MARWIDVNSGKYTVVIYDTGRMEALRYNETWRDLLGDNLVYWLAVELDDARNTIHAKQAEIDRLMLEFCPEEMTTEQINAWKQAQRCVGNHD